MIAKKHIVKVIVSQQLSEELQHRIEAFISKKHVDESIEFDYEIDNSILGGLLIIDGAKYYDGTLKHQLIRMRKDIK